MKSAERPIDVGLDLLDRLVLDCDGVPLGRVDDLELVHLDDGSLAVVGLLVGPQAWGRRMGSRFGGAVEQLARRLRNGAGPVRIAIRDVAGMDPSVRLARRPGAIRA